MTGAAPRIGVVQSVRVQMLPNSTTPNTAGQAEGSDDEDDAEEPLEVLSESRKTVSS